MNMWIRNSKFDAVWFLSGVPFAITFLLAAIFIPWIISVCPVVRFPFSPGCNGIDVVGGVITIYAIVLLDMGHNISPIVIAWRHREFRGAMLRRPLKFIAVPIGLLVLGTLAGVIAENHFPHWTPFINATIQWTTMLPLQIRNPFWWLILFYVGWNFYHFAKQNFGILSIYRLKSGCPYPANQRRIDLTFAFTVQAAVSGVVLLNFVHSNQMMELLHLIYVAVAAGLIAFVIRDAAIAGRCWTPRTIFALGHAICPLYPGIFALAVNAMNHWMSAIGLAGHVDGVTHRRSPLWFAAVIIVLGVALFAIMFGAYPPRWSWNLRDMIALALPYAGFRLALGFVHFLFDRWIWKRPSPIMKTALSPRLVFVASGTATAALS